MVKTHRDACPALAQLPDGQALLDVLAQAEESADLGYLEENVSAALLAGQAEIATGLLHNIGNVLNSLNTSATLLADRVRELRTTGLAKAAALVQAQVQVSNLACFLSEDRRGKQLLAYLASLADYLGAERQALLAECQAIGQHVEHIKRIVAQQQMYAKPVGVSEPVHLAELVEEVLSLSVSGHHDIALVRQYQTVPPLVADKHKLLQIVINLINNAKQALYERGSADKRLTVRIGPCGAGRAQVAISDNGVGIAPEHLARVFAFGFTTKPQGHGFGLHASANAAAELGGRLSCESAGRGCGATFTLELPLRAMGAAA